MRPSDGHEKITTNKAKVAINLHTMKREHAVRYYTSYKELLYHMQLPSEPFYKVNRM